MEKATQLPDLIRTRSATLALLRKNRRSDYFLTTALSDNGYDVTEFYNRSTLMTWLEKNTPDMVLVELDMSGASMATIAAVRSRYPLLPILSLADGCDGETIQNSIISGANHFVGDSADQNKLTSAIDRLVNFRMEYLRYVQVLPYLRSRIEASIPSKLELLGGLVYYLTEELFKHGIITLRQINVKVAFVEALTNAMEHGNKLDESKYVHIHAEVSQESARIDISDEGPGFDPDSLPDPTSKENLFSPRGRGIFMMRQFMDEVTFHSPGNKVTLIKYRSADDVIPRPYPWERRLL